MLKLKALVALLLLITLSASSLGVAQSDQSSPADVEALAQRIAAASIGDSRKLLVEQNKKLVTPQLLRLLTNLGVQDKDPQRGLDLLQFTKQLARDLRDHRSILQTSTQIGIILLRTEQQEQAKKSFQEIREMLPTVEDEFESGMALLAIGRAHTENGLYGDSFPWYEEAKSKLQRLTGQDGLKGIAESWKGIGVAHMEAGSHDQSLTALRKADELYATLGDIRGQAGVANDIGTVYDELGYTVRAKQSYMDALKRLESLGAEKHKEQIAVIKVNLALLQTTHLGEYDEALQNFAAALPLIEANRPKSSIAGVYLNMAIAHHQDGKGDLALALEFARKAYQLFEGRNPEPAIDALNEIASIQLSQKDFKGALGNSVDAARRAASLRIPPALWIALNTKGRALMELGAAAEAKEALDEAIKVVDELTSEAYGDESARASFFAGMVYPYQSMVELLFRQKDYTTALLYAERSKAKTLIHALAGQRANWSKGMTNQQKEEEQNLVKKLTEVNVEIRARELNPQWPLAEKEKLQAQRDRLRQQIEEFRIRLYKAAPDLKARRVSLDISDLNEFRTVLPHSNAVALHYMVTPSSALLLVVTKGRNNRIQVTGRSLQVHNDELAIRIRSFRSFLEAGPRGGFDTESKNLYRLLLQPAEEELRNKELVAIVPDGILWELPFQALLNTKEKYFFEDHAIFYSPSLSALSKMGQARQNRTRSYRQLLLAFGNPDLGTTANLRKPSNLMGEELGPLPQAEEQVNEIAKLFPSRLRIVHCCAQATENRLKKEAPGARIIHLAAHGILDNSSPLYSYIVLSQSGDAKQEDGYLETWELMNLNLRATEMVVLSACESGRGALRPGEGIIGLTWAAFIGGSPTTVASQWKVDATSTSLLMKTFYKNLFSQRSGLASTNQPTVMSKAKALQLAMRELLNPKGRYAHPAFWAGFIVVGDGR